MNNSTVAMCGTGPVFPFRATPFFVGFVFLGLLFSVVFSYTPLQNHLVILSLQFSNYFRFSESNVDNMCLHNTLLWFKIYTFHELLRIKMTLLYKILWNVKITQNLDYLTLTVLWKRTQNCYQNRNINS